ncbi:MAG: hypothetical protein VX527_04450 [Planctomycetota bacterium]|nr:hypothetical protein [Planctomycetota bacterium]
MTDAILKTQIQLATTWFLAARTMAVADGNVPEVKEAAAGLYARAILELPEQVCIEAKRQENIGSLKIEDCLLSVRNLPRELGEKIMTGVMMIAYANRDMHPLEVRWASMLASAIGLSEEDFQRCCVGARVIATMLNPSAEEGD